MTRGVHIVGAGLAGLAAAVSCAAAGRAVTLYEAGPAAGGRCRSYLDRGLGRRIDNGNHLVLSGNDATFSYLTQVGAADALVGPAEPLFPFVDLADGLRWVVAPNAGRVPWWIFFPGRRVPGTRPKDYLALLALRRAGAQQTVREALGGRGPLYRRLLEPLAIAALNTPPDAGLARLLGTVVAETLMRGGTACLPRVPRVGLSESFVDPALAWLSAQGATLHTGRRVAALRRGEARVTALDTSDGPVPLGADDDVVLAVPAWVAIDLLPGLIAPDAFCAILNVHFPVAADPGRAGFWGVVGGTAEWIFVRDGVVSVTISAANRLVDLSAEDIAARVWRDVRAVLALPEPMPPVRVVKERRATHAATAAQEARRPGPRTAWRNLVLAGDWTATGLPATIEGAIRSGRAAADLLLAS
jgi:squalene-associated FAD-dependent desaturase